MAASLASTTSIISASVMLHTSSNGQYESEFSSTCDKSGTSIEEWDECKSLVSPSIESRSSESDPDGEGQYVYSVPAVYGSGEPASFKFSCNGGGDGVR